MGNSFSGGAQKVSCPVLEGQDSETMKNQEGMQKMPLVTLAEVCEIYLKIVQPLLSAAELEQTKKVLADFQAGDGPAYYAKIEENDKSATCWIEEDYQNVYLMADCSNYSLNPSFVLEKKHDTQADAAADFCRAALEYHHKVRTGTLEAWATRAGPLCMKQLPLFFASARVATESGTPDISQSYLEYSRHIAFVRNGLFYALEVLTPEGELLVDKATLVAKINEIKAMADAASGAAVGALTTAARTIWAPARARLTALSASNKASFEGIDSALFVVCLDGATALSAEKMVQNVMYGVAGTTHNRWLDKWSLIVCEDGQAGINWEHSAIDGQTMQEIIADIHKGYDGGASIKPDVTGATIKALPFEVDAEATAAAIEAATAEGVKLGDAHGITTLEYKKYGASFIKTAKCSPDGFLQAAMAMAWKKYKGTTPVTYESVLTKAYKHGRVFVARNTNQGIADALDAFAAGGGKKEAVAAISKEVTGMCKLAAGAKDIDRPFLAMKNLAKKEGKTIPVFDDPSWAKLGAINLCTSHCGKPPIRFFCFEAVPDGFGIGYNANPDGSQWNITHSTSTAEAEKFKAILVETLDELHAACS